MKKIPLLFFLLLLLGSTLRIWSLNVHPSLQEDEAAIGYNAYSILLTGKDITGVSYPLTTTSLGDARPALYLYLTLLPIKLFGLTPLSIRIPAFLASIAAIVAMYMIAYQLFKSRTVAMLASFFMSFSYWHIILSREASEKMTALSMVLFAIVAILHYFANRKMFWLITGFVLLLISSFTYYEPRLFIFLFVPVLFLLGNLGKLGMQTKNKLPLILTGFFLLIVVYITFFSTGGTDRASQLLVFTHPETQALLQEQLGEAYGEVPFIISRIFHNKPVQYAFTITRNFLSYFTGSFWYLSGGESPRYKVPFVGLANIFELPLFLVGLYLLVQQCIQKKHKELLIPLVWFLIPPLYSSLAFHEVPSSHRTTLMLPAYILIVSFGAVGVLNLIRKSKLHIATFTIFCGLYLFHLLFFVNQYFVHFEKHQPWYRNYAQKELALFLKDHAKEYDYVITTSVGAGTNHVIPFYLQYDPVIYQQNWESGKTVQDLENIQFIDMPCVYPKLTARGLAQGRYLLINHGECEKDSFGVETMIIRYRDGVPAYRLIPYTSSAEE